MPTYNHLIFLHGLHSSSQGFKATLLRERYPGAQTPDFRGSLDERMTVLEPILAARDDWVIVGSSFGGLMGALYACAHPQRVRKLILFAPALIRPAFGERLGEHLPTPIDVPTIVIQGTQDRIIPLAQVQPLAERVFTNLDFRVVDDDHGLRRTAQTVDWDALISVSR